MMHVIEPLHFQFDRTILHARLDHNRETLCDLPMPSNLLHMKSEQSICSIGYCRLIILEAAVRICRSSGTSHGNCKFCITIKLTLDSNSTNLPL